MRPIKTSLVAILILASVMTVLTTTAQAQIYKWVDDKGVTNYSGTPPKGASSAMAPAILEDRVSVISPQPALAPLSPAPAYDRIAALERELQAQRDALRYAIAQTQQRSPYDECLAAGQRTADCDALLQAAYGNYGYGYGYAYPVVVRGVRVRPPMRPPIMKPPGMHGSSVRISTLR
jgi:hypothetical protein